jgi:hypothetical protein
LAVEKVKVVSAEGNRDATISAAEGVAACNIPPLKLVPRFAGAAKPNTRRQASTHLPAFVKKRRTMRPQPESFRAPNFFINIV